MSRSYWDFVLACAFAFNAIGPAYDVWESARGSTSDRLLAAHGSLAQQAGETGGATLIGVAVAAVIWLVAPISEPVLSWVGVGATFGLLAGLHIWTVRKLLPKEVLDAPPIKVEQIEFTVRRPVLGCCVVMLAGLVLGVSWLFMQLSNYLHGLARD
ncbi:hypothetical protein [Streptomyces sp. NPDC047976]|uniref:hypothetical protein n=1 Tax=unclassified Streptomyces TaxID=2593676 RepID=UPI00341C5D21